MPSDVKKTLKIVSRLEGQRLSEVAAKLPFIADAAFDSYANEYKLPCLEGTRVELLNEILAWSRQPTGPCIYWLNGVAGSGKSSIAKSVAYRFRKEKCLGATFFFLRNDTDRGNAKRFFTTLAVQLCTEIPALQSPILDVLNGDLSIPGKELQQQWKDLILEPLRNITITDTANRTLCVVIDALDECNDDEVQRILRLLSQAASLETVRLRIFITSRPETPSRLGFKEIAGVHQAFSLQSIEKFTIRRDIKAFLGHELGKIRRNHDLHSKWPGEEKIDRLCQRASQLFIYAATACRYIADPEWPPDESLSMILKDSYVGQSTIDLDNIYTTILRNAIRPSARDKDILFRQFRQIVGLIIVLSEALSATTLARLLHIKTETITARLLALHSVLDVPDENDSPIRLLHLSFRDFLLDPGRCHNLQLRVDEQQANSELFRCCLRIMNQHLKEDMCDLRYPGWACKTGSVGSNVIDQCIAPELKYSCRHWITHLQASEIKVCDNDEVHLFLKTHFLHWLETLSLLGYISDGIQAVKILESMTTVSSA